MKITELSENETQNSPGTCTRGKCVRSPGTPGTVRQDGLRPGQVCG
jgi:hypothetical protein